MSRSMLRRCPKCNASAVPPAKLNAFNLASRQSFPKISKVRLSTVPVNSILIQFWGFGNTSR